MMFMKRISNTRKLLSILAVFVVFVLVTRFKNYVTKRPPLAKLKPFVSVVPSVPHTNTSKTLITYAYNECGTVCLRNLQYFMRVAVSPLYKFVIVTNGPCTYCASDEFMHLKKAANVTWVQRENSGFDFAAYHAALDAVDRTEYDYFLFVNGGMRGPLVPKWQFGEVRVWPEMFTGMLNEHVKLVGSTISCQVHVHVQSFLFATDIIGLKLFWENGVFDQDGESIIDLIQRSELGMSRLIFEAGYTVDSMIYYKKPVEWRHLYSLKLKEDDDDMCNLGRNPTILDWFGEAGRYPLPPLLTVFVKQGSKLI